MTPGERLRVILLQRGMTAADLSRITSAEVSTIHRWLRDANLPRSSSMIDVLRGLRLSLGEFMRGVDPPHGTWMEYWQVVAQQVPPTLEELCAYLPAGAYLQVLGPESGYVVRWLDDCNRWHVFQDDTAHGAVSQALEAVGREVR